MATVMKYLTRRNFIYFYLCLIVGYPIAIYFAGYSFIAWSGEDTCRIPEMDPFDKTAMKLIADSQLAAGGDTPECLSVISRRQTLFRIEQRFEANFLLKMDPSSVYWSGNNSACCFIGFEHKEITPELQLKINNYMREEKSIHQHSNSIKFHEVLSQQSLETMDQKACEAIIGNETVIPPRFEWINVRCTSTSEFEEKLEHQAQFLFMKVDLRLELSRYFKLYTQEDGPKFLNIILFGISSVSRVNFQRFMPKTRDYLLRNLSAIEFYGRNALSLETIGNLMPVLTGCKKSPTSLSPESFAEKCTLIWKKFARKGYRTFKSEDDFELMRNLYPGLKEAGNGTGNTDYDWLQYLNDMAGILKSGTTEQDRQGSRYTHGCFEYQWGPELMLERAFRVANYFGPNNDVAPYFNFLWSSIATHDAVGQEKHLDDPVLNFFQQLSKQNLLNNTVLIFMSDHGMAYGPYGTSFEGSTEARIPFLFMRFPAWFKRRYMVAIRNLRKNAAKLTTPFDLHETLLDLLDIENTISNSVLVKRLQKPSKNRGISLFQQIPSTSSCRSANVPPEMCICSARSSIPKPKYNSAVVRISEFTIGYLNAKLLKYDVCAKLQLDQIVSAGKVKPPKSDHHYELVIKTLPSMARFQVSARISYTNHVELIGNVTRLNTYGTQSKCLDNIKSKSVGTWIRSICFCK